ncbi:transcriptional regulator, AraC family [Saccharopolyspora shandongensis]|uniref:Transcriptional regulator, AraC family n=1 Tax=Saccharopolyspora shandongensis TaxID=418495 RepID=A0A1H3MPE6_9PSEU|nr:transcriptional regulator, AraC family [Saccharopolyspora shandongensis]
MVWLWPGEALYAGPSLRLDAHSGSVSCLAVGVDEALDVLVDGASSRVLSAFIPPRLPNRISSPGRRMAFYFVEPGSARERSCRARMRPATKIHNGHERERELAELGRRLADPNAVRRWVERAAGSEPTTVDDRSREALELLRADPDLSAERLAAAVHLSTSHFLRLFKRDTGTTLRRYRLWSRMLAAAGHIAGGADLTAAATAAGFANPSHFSAAFHAMFGLSPSRLLATPVEICVPTR